MTLRSAFIIFTVLSAFLATSQVFALLPKIHFELRPKLSSKASIVHIPFVPTRYSSYEAPQPGTTVNVATEKDVVETVKYCVKNKIKFLVQSGGHGWATTFNIGLNDVVINMRGLKKISLNAAKNQLTFEGGALVGEVLEYSYQNGVQTTISSCDCVGMSGAALGGGFNMLMGKYGLVIDNFLSINLVTAEGKLVTVTPTSSPDLWWALRGAGANFGVVTSITMKVYPPMNNGLAWIGQLTYTPDKLEALVQLVSDFEYQEGMFVWMHFRPGLPIPAPSIIVDLVYYGSEKQGKALYKAFYNLGPLFQTSRETTYNKINSILSGLGCTKGLRVPCYTAGLKELDPKIFRKIYQEYLLHVLTNPLLTGTVITIEGFSPSVVRQFGDSSSAFPHRDINFLALITMQYVGSIFDPIAERFGEKVRDLLRESSGFTDLKAYVNYGHGDEDLSQIYGDSLTRLKAIKKTWDKDGHFSQFFPIPRQ